jgi:hypothetical protein
MVDILEKVIARENYSDFAFPSLSRRGLTNFVTKLNHTQGLYCSCEAKLYKPDGYICSHMFDVLLGESAPSEQKPSIDALLGVLNGLEMFVLSQHKKEPLVFIQKQDSPSIDEAVIIYSSNPKWDVIDYMRKEGYWTTGIFFDPIVKNRDTLKRIQQQNLPSLYAYLSRSVRNNLDCLEKGYGYGIAKCSDILYLLEKKRKNLTSASVIKSAVNELKEVIDYKKLKSRSVERTKASLKYLPKYYLQIKKVHHAKRDLMEHSGRRKTEPFDFTKLSLEDIFAIMSDVVFRNIAKGFFLRDFLNECYMQLGKEISQEVYHLPTHHLEKIYEAVTGQKMRGIRLLSSG